MKVGITGGIGSGKTTVCKIFETLGIPVYYADDRAKQLMTEDVKLVTNIKKAFGQSAYQANGELNRTYLANIVFSNSQQLQKLNALVHPAVFEDAEKWHILQNNVPYTLKEAALLFESGSFRTLDKIICVYAPKGERIKRVMKRDQVSEQQLMDRLNKQLSDNEKMQLSDYIITNNQQNSLIQQVLSIHHQLLNSTI